MIAFAFIMVGVTALASILCGIVAMCDNSSTADFYQRQFLGNAVVFCAAALLAVVT